MSRQKKFKIGTVLAGLLVTLAVIMLISPSGQSSNVTLEVAPVAVEVTPVEIQTITETVTAVGTVSALNDVIVSSETAGRITRVLVKVGDFVQAGQPLVLVDNELKAIAVDQARAQLLAAETSHEKARSDNERAAMLFSNGDISSTEAEAYRLGLRSAEAAHKGAEVALRFAQRQLEDTRIKSPISGYVASRKVELGEMVTPGKEIANVVDISKVKVKLSIPEEDITKLQLRQQATLRVDPRPDKEFQGVIYSIGAKTESPVGHTYPVEVVVEGKDIAMLKVGMFARVEIRAKSFNDALAISKEALVGDDTQPGVFVVESGRAKMRPVRLGVRSGEQVQVVEGLNAGDLVVSFGQKKLKDGAAVLVAQK